MYEKGASYLISSRNPTIKVSNTPYRIANRRARANGYELPNDDYEIFVMGKVDGTQYLLSNIFLSLDEQSGNVFLVIDQEDKGVDSLSLNIFNQNDAN